jgi:hypothetical protein
MKWHEKHDLARWNRAGLGHLRYIDGNAVTYLETLRQQLVEEFDQGGSPSWSELVERFPIAPDETSHQARQRLQAQYYDERRDYAWEILRSLARSVHILGEYTNAYANEMYLPTATEWDNVRRLVGILGYRPAPPASAQTYIALLFKEGESGQVNPGFALKNKPADGEPTIVFETLEPITGSSALNQLKLKGWDRNPELIQPFLKAKTKAKPLRIRFPLASLPDAISVGDLGVLATEDQGLPVTVTRIATNTTAPWVELKSLSKQTPDASFRYHNTRLYLQPDFTEQPLPNGPYSAQLSQDTALNEGEIVFARQANGWWVARVEQNASGLVQLANPSKTPQAGAKLYRARNLNRQENHFAGSTGSYIYVFPQGQEKNIGIVVDENLSLIHTAGRQGARQIRDRLDNLVETTRYLRGNWGRQAYYPEQQAVTSLQQVGLDAIRFSGKAKALEPNHWVILNYADGTVLARQIQRVEQQKDWFALDFSDTHQAHLSTLRTNFKLELSPRNHAVNTRQAWHASSSKRATVLELEDHSVSGQLQPGRKLICAGDGYAIQVEISQIETAKGVTRLHLSPAFHTQRAATGLTRHACVLYANVAHAGHGETRPGKILGSGDATQTRQKFSLPQDKIAWVADATFSAGVRADLTLTVGQRVWQQVQNLAQSSAEDHHYQVDVDEDGALSVSFGDGRHGRRLPTGNNNVHVSYRVGYGEAGNLAADALVKISKPHRLVDDFVAPLAASGGADKESVDSMREHAPATVLALQRAVSLDDFTHLAAHHSMVWQAKAFEKMPDRPARSRIEVVIVAAGGATFGKGAPTAVLIEKFLRQHSAPDTPVSVVSYVPVLLDLKVSLMVDEAAFDKKQVELAVRETLQNALALKQRNLGQPLFRTEVIALLEQVEGVENGHCEIRQAPYAAMPDSEKPLLHRRQGDTSIRRVSVKPHQVLYLDSTVYPVEITSEQYEA